MMIVLLSADLDRKAVVIHNYRNLNSHIDVHTHTGSAFGKRVTLTLDLVTSVCRSSEIMLY